ncbi:hypothetical protein [Cellulomonas olei]|uniref:hypothetical protein n=1 Tax=Cellulomonas sp. P4 TaxID=3142533 RepID=UPI0031BACD4B
MNRVTTRLRSSIAALVLAAATVFVAASPASAALPSGCALYPSAPYTSGTRIYFSATATCGASNPVISRVEAALQRSGTTVANVIQTSSGTTTLRASGSSGCPAGTYRTYAWANDKNTNATEGGSAYKSLSC